MAPADLRSLSSHERGNETFVKNFYGKSRLHWIGTWNDRFEEYLAKREKQYGPLVQLRLPSSSTIKKRVVLHIDMDAFFASVSSLGKPQLQGKPVAVSWGSGAEGGAKSALPTTLRGDLGLKRACG